jgi:hypothetical protein
VRAVRPCQALVGAATLTGALFKSVNARLTSLDKERDGLAIKIKDELYAAENWGAPVPGAPGQTASCEAVIGQARQLALSA